MAAIRINREPAAWGKKYSVALFQVFLWREKNRRGRNLIMLISKAAHRRNQLVEFRATRVEETNAEMRRRRSLLIFRVEGRVIVAFGV